MQNSQCANCAAVLHEDYNYCPACSQKVRLHRLSLHEIAHEAIHYFTHADKGFFQLIKALLVKGGIVAREYMQGKRKKYFPPLNFYLIVGALFVFVTTLLEKKENADVLKQHPEIKAIEDPLRRAAVTRIWERQGEAVGFMNHYANIVAMVALPLIAIIFWFFYRKGKYNYTEHLVGCMYMSGITNLIYVLIFVPVSVFSGMEAGKFSYYLIYVVFQVIYYSWFYYRFTDFQKRRPLLKSIAVSTLAVFAWSAISSLLIGLYIRNGFWGVFH